MAGLFAAIELLDQRSSPGSPALNMAMDEALLAGLGEIPVLRVYRWRAPAVSFGYFLPSDAARQLAGERPVIRRWTGGGMVEHGRDFTWSLIVPADCPVHSLRPRDAYGALHGAVVRALGQAGIAATQVPLDLPAPAGGLCMTAPAPGDVIFAGRKIAGAGQRRTRAGLLHQGTIGGVELPESFPRLLAATLADEMTAFPQERIPAVEAAALVESRYGTEAWLNLR